ncbi:Uncharacterised protein [Yersinia intermedia]|nr:Uncharacterised protein [Yersinia intermedia]
MQLNFISKSLTLLFFITTTAISSGMGGYVTLPPEVCLY